MDSDESQIRALVQQWHAASQAGETDHVLELMTDDVVFLTVGRPPMSKSEFAALSRIPPGVARPRMEIEQEIQEIVVLGELAYMRSQLSVCVHPPQATEPIERSGPTLTIFQKVNGRWLLARDANLLIAKSSP